MVLRDGADAPLLGAVIEGRAALRLRVPERGGRLTIVTGETVEPGEPGDPGALIGLSAVDAAKRTHEQLISAHDPCISCATQFLDLSVERRASP